MRLAIHGLHNCKREIRISISEKLTSKHHKYCDSQRLPRSSSFSLNNRGIQPRSRKRVSECQVSSGSANFVCKKALHTLKFFNPGASCLYCRNLSNILPSKQDVRENCLRTSEGPLIDGGRCVGRIDQCVFP